MSEGHDRVWVFVYMSVDAGWEQRGEGRGAETMNQSTTQIKCAREPLCLSYIPSFIVNHCRYLVYGVGAHKYNTLDRRGRCYRNNNGYIVNITKK
jgi:hypothetical protein